MFRRRRSKDKKVDDYYKDLHETTIFSNVDVDEEESNERPIVRSTEPRIAYRPKLPVIHLANFSMNCELSKRPVKIIIIVDIRI